MNGSLLARNLPRLGVGVIATTVGEQLWHAKTFLGLRCDLSAIRPVTKTEPSFIMRPEVMPDGKAFLEEFPRVRGRDVIELVLRVESCAAGIQTLYVGRDGSGKPGFAQWLVMAADQEPLHAHAPGRYDRLEQAEGLLEGAYTFVEFRGRRLMAEGMGQLLDAAKSAGLTTMYTYVSVDNVPSLRGCARVGFVPDHTRISTRRLGLRRSRRLPLDDQALAAWEAALGEAGGSPSRPATRPSTTDAT